MVRSAGAALARRLVGVAITFALVGCLFPEYTFDEAPGGGGNASTSTSPTSSATTADTTSSTGTLGGGGEGGGPPTEDCFTAGDEDGDQLEDCADPDCGADVECVDAIPVGWNTLGYLAVFRGSTGSDPACPPGTEEVVYTGNADLGGTTPACTTCGCMSPTWSSCQFFEDLDPGKPGLQAVYPGDDVCGSFGSGVTLTVPSPWAVNDCEPLSGAPGQWDFADTAQARPSGGSCTGMGGVSNAGTAAWQDTVKACRVVGGLGGCTAPQACVPQPAGTYEPRVCIGRAGAQTCPGGFTQEIEAFGDFTDTRACSACTCGAGTGGACVLGVTIYSDTGCATPVGSGNSNTCVDLGGAGTAAVGSAMTTLVTAPSGGSCPSTGGGVPSGAVTETDPTTFCCLP